MKLVSVIIPLMLASCEPNAGKALEIPCCDEHGECFPEEPEALWETENESGSTGNTRPRRPLDLAHRAVHFLFRGPKDLPTPHI